MKMYSSAQAAKALGLTPAAITKYIKSGKIPVPKMMEGANRYIWTAADIEHVRQLLPKIANGRKTRYKKKQSAKTKAQPRAAVPRKQRKPKKKK
ncbi:MAG TPA: MerR family transcriptional regulator [Candidatus Angelobacter sp.]|jgi:predicted transcriptional regulator|nr:MerR family transcriptional regulator [Candidatus Angelobacter sp.]